MAKRALPVVSGSAGGLLAGLYLLRAQTTTVQMVSQLSPKVWAELKLIAKEPISHNTAKYRFELPDKAASVGLPVASAIQTGAHIGEVKDDGTVSMVTRPYTPISPKGALGYFDLVVKDYPDGIMSSHISGLSVGDFLAVRGPFVKFDYQANFKKQIGMVAGGTGIAPMLQVLEEILSNPEDKTKVSVLFANVTQEDILLKERIDALAATHSNVKVTYVLDRPRSAWQGKSGFVTAEMLMDTMPPPSADSWILVCGPPPMMKAVSGPKAKDFTQGEVSGCLKELGYTPEHVFKL
eukprot:CAMPEP_0198198808 /NCGR_PEP_ID=MMETSP1445-20131203/2185_1 /TAXON_ID=36898 /ORGANISM="Pyramimonas sp., Strain CCMP2087" /LENGTH=293 /DNA_ID=CAMNT_0043868449 /DNA_START=479 /DNA_END=1360 /DNA_ORIENTATION=-